MRIFFIFSKKFYFVDESKILDSVLDTPLLRRIIRLLLSLHAPVQSGESRLARQHASKGGTELSRGISRRASHVGGVGGHVCCWYVARFILFLNLGSQIWVVIGDPPDINNIFPPRPVPTKRGPPLVQSQPSIHPLAHSHLSIPVFTTALAEDSTSTTSTHTSHYSSTTNTTNTNGTNTAASTKPTTTGVGFFTPDASSRSTLETGMGVGNLFHPLRHEMRRMGPRDSMQVFVLFIYLCEILFIYF